MTEAIMSFSNSSSPAPPQSQPHPDDNIDPRLLQSAQSNDPSMTAAVDSSQPPDPQKGKAGGAIIFAPIKTPTNPPPLGRMNSERLEGLLPGISGYLPEQQGAHMSSGETSARYRAGRGSSPSSDGSNGKFQRAKTVRVVSPGQNPQRLWEEKQKQEAAQRDAELCAQEERDETQYEIDGGDKG
ncbi:Hypothetical predicted protein [Lecanosticta acicola]|uniref:Uncharacterized protein n=1 Tax=Lecanosticta acicola TaxID=111012 RepID=A0AAI8Z5Q4_9PEZI|nr:Hypothetical predicted protein [Lecanosticta acicola]